MLRRGPGERAGASVRPLRVLGHRIVSTATTDGDSPEVGPKSPTGRQVLFACTHNAGRSQIAAAFFNLLADPARARAISAGTDPVARVHPEVVAVMREVGIDLAGARPRHLTAELAGTAELLITMGCGERCPVVPGARREDWPIEDPRGQSLKRVREIRDAIRKRVETLVAAEALARLV